MRPRSSFSVSLARRRPPARPSVPSGVVWVIANPAKHRSFEAFRTEVTSCAQALGVSEIHWELTTREDPGTGAAVRAVAAGASRVIVAGGDGTVRAVAAGLAHSGIPLGILPEGTGNILARNLTIPLHSRKDALRIALGDEVQTIDLGWLRIENDEATCKETPLLPAEGYLLQQARAALATQSSSVGGAVRSDTSLIAADTPESTPLSPSLPRADEWAFLTIAGCGFDGETMGQTNASLKKLLGWPAYVLAALSATRTPRLHARLHLTPGTGKPREAQLSARCLMFANCPRLPLVTLAPDSSYSDGLLDVIRADTRGYALGWTTLALRIFLQSASPRWEHLSLPWMRMESTPCREAYVQLREPAPVQVDGDPVGSAHRVYARLDHGALRISCPPSHLTKRRAVRG